MAHSTVFPLTNELKEAFAAEVGSSTPTASFFQIRIQDETLVMKTKAATYEPDMAKVFEMVQSDVEEAEPCYYAVRKVEAGGAATHKWIMVMYVPDWAKVKDRMLYAATRDTVKRGLGSGNFVQEVLVSEKAGLSWDVIQEDISVEAPLTENEKLEMEEKLLETDSAAEVRGKAVFAFPIENDAMAAIKDFAGGSANFVQLKLDTEGEKIQLDLKVDDMEVTKLDEYFREGPRYTLFNLVHTPPTSEKQTTAAVLYMTCPMSAPIKQKMLSATLKTSVVQLVESAGITVAKQFDTDNDKTDVTELAILSQLYGELEEQKTVTKEVKRAGKGGRKMISGRQRKKLDDDDDDMGF